MLKLLYIGLKYDYGIPSRGFSFEYLNIYNTIINMHGIEASFFPFDEVMRKVGRSKMNNQLLNVIDEIEPDICFFVLFTDEITQSTIRKITEHENTVTLNWFGDDHWRFASYSRWWAPLFTWSVTTDSESLENYREQGIQNVVLSQWGFNHRIYLPMQLPCKYDVTFIGQVHSRRDNFISSLKQNGVKVTCWGKGWPNGRINQDEMIRIYSQSKINLNFTDSSPSFRLRPLLKTFITRRADDTFRINSFAEMKAHLMTLFTPRRSQIKGRNFEITGAGGFLLTQHAPNLETYFQPDKEIAIFYGVEDLIEKIRFYLLHEEIRENIRQMGHKRALREHTFEARLGSIFSSIGLRSEINTPKE